jgi:hypothetical protein
MDCVVLVDNSNLYIEGQKCSAKRRGMVQEKPGDRQPMDVSWRIDFSRLLAELASGRTIKGAVLVGSKPPPNDAVWAMAKRAGFQVVTHDRESLQQREGC